MTHVCRACSAPLHSVFADLGRSPLSNEFKTEAQLDIAEETYPLKVFVCDKCKFVQLPNHVYPGKIFNEDYAYFSSVSKSWVEHARQYADMMCERLSLNRRSLVVEVGGNDGYLLQHFKDRTLVLNVEPSANVARASWNKGISTHEAFMNLEEGRYIREKRGAADLIHGANVLAHTPDIHSFIAGCAACLAPNGLITFEFPWLYHLIDKMLLDTIYHEHYSYLSLLALEPILEQYGLSVIDVEELPTHGGSLRVFIGHEAARCAGWSVSERVVRARITEHSAALHEMPTYTEFAKKCIHVKVGALDFLIDTHTDGCQIYGYTAPAKATTLLNYLGVGPELIPYIIEDAPAKIGKFVPGVQIPIVSPHDQNLATPTDVVVFAWNLIDEIVPKVKALYPDADIWTILPEVTLHP